MDIPRFCINSGGPSYDIAHSIDAAEGDTDNIYEHPWEYISGKYVQMNWLNQQ